MWQSLGDFDFVILHTYTWYLQKLALKNPNALPTRRYLTKSASKAQLSLISEGSVAKRVFHKR